MVEYSAKILASEEKATTTTYWPDRCAVSRASVTIGVARAVETVFPQSRTLHHFIAFPSPENYLSRFPETAAPLRGEEVMTVVDKRGVFLFCF